MFTGIIQCMGSVTGMHRHEGGIRLCLDVHAVVAATRVGDSICVSGVCLTVAAKTQTSLEFDIICETLERTTLGRLVPGDFVNLELSRRMGDRLDGHIVQGHVDGTASVQDVTSNAAEHIIWLRPQPHLLPYIVPKGSITVEGVSLTVAALDADRFSVALIPTTLALTTLGRLQPGDFVNIESDCLARMVVHHLNRLLGADEKCESPTDPQTLRDLLSRTLMQVAP